MHDDGAVEACQRVRRVPVGLARVDHDRLAELRGELELCIEEPPLPLPRRPVAEVVEARLADRDRSLVLEELTQLAETGGFTVAGLVRVDAECGEDLLVQVRELERRPARLDARSDRDDPVDSRRTGAADEG